MARIVGSILALLLILFGLVVAAVSVVLIWQANSSAQGNGATVETAGADAALRGAGGQALLVGVESGGMALSTPAPAALVVMAAPQDEPLATLPPEPTSAPTSAPTPDPCPPLPAEGFAADTAVVAVGMLRIYSQADVTAATLGELGAGQGLWIVAGEDGATAVRRCEIVWQRVRTSDGRVGWVLADAVAVVVPTAVPTAAPSPSAIPIQSPCVDGCSPCAPPCPQPTPCYQPCPTPCLQPCVGQPCTTPCGAYAK